LVEGGDHYLAALKLQIHELIAAGPLDV
jgi:hypothetical protein